jgi:protein TonB
MLSGTRILCRRADRQRADNRNLGAALAISIGLHLAAIGLYVATSAASAGTEADPTLRTPITIEIRDYSRDVLPDLARPDERSRTSPAPAGRPASAMAMTPSPTRPRPVADDQARMTREFPAYDTQTRLPEFVDDSISNGIGDGGIGTRGGVGDVDGSGIESNDGDIPPADFVDPEIQLPEVDPSELLERTRYPEAARRHGLEGTVVLRVLLGVNGSIERVEVEHTTSAIFDAAALDAVKGFTVDPARVAGRPVRAWLRIPFRFRLE